MRAILLLTILLAFLNLAKAQGVICSILDRFEKLRIGKLRSPVLGLFVYLGTYQNH